MTSFGWDYPPGVTGNEPQISGIWPIESVLDQAYEDLKKAFDLVENVQLDLEEQFTANRLGALSDSIVKSFDSVLDGLDSLKSDIYAEVPEPSEY